MREKKTTENNPVIPVIVLLLICMILPASAGELKTGENDGNRTKELCRIETAKRIDSLSISSDDENLALGTDKGIYVYNFAKGTIAKAYSFIGRVNQLKYSNTGKYLGFISFDDYGFIDTKTKKAVRYSARDLLPGETQSIFFSTEDKLFFVDPSKKGIKAISTETGEAVFYLDSEFICYDFLFPDSNNENAFALFKNCLYQFDTGTKKLIGKFNFRVKKSKFRRTCVKIILPDSKSLIQIVNNTVMQIDFINNQVIKEKSIKNTFNMTDGVSYDKTRSRFCVSGNKVVGDKVFNEYFLFVFSIDSLDLLIPPIKLPDYGAYCMSPSGKFVVFADKGKLYRIDLEKKGLKR